MKPLRVVIVGGGFAAVQFAKTLRGKLRPSECEILLFNRENHMVFHPLLADVAGASINADAAAAPLRQMLPGAGCRTERVQRIDLPSSEIEFEDGNGALTRLPYDHVVLACGAESNLGIIPGMSDHAFAFKVMRDATKPEIKKAVETLFGVKVEAVRVANVHGKVKRQGRFVGRRPDWKKAYVVLKKGEKMVEFFDQA